MSKLSERDQWHAVPTFLDDADLQELEDLAETVEYQVETFEGICDQDAGERQFIHALEARR